ncbi:hypothetical protein F5884DRAFT_743690 [Xylogone sp. PMI_703]|nr:hypothetical protein F5884DRAFT_743690 [Xylogone sp. PMI_703]
MRSSRGRYDVVTNHELDEDEIEEEGTSGRESLPRPSAWRILGWHGWLLLLVFQFVLLGLALLIFSKWFILPRTNLSYAILTADNKSFPSGPLTWSQRFETLPCGRTPSEALARGCHFDMIATAWLPPRCIDFELVEEFMAIGNWEFYTTHNGTTRYSNEPDVLGSEMGVIWATNGWHAAHCLYMWKKLNRALVNGWSTDAETVTQSHTGHCIMTVEELALGRLYEPEKRESIMQVIYPPC